MYYDFQTQLVIGTVLGGASLVIPPKGKNYYLSMRGNNEMWLRYKMEEMPSYFNCSKMYKYGNTFRVNSCCDEKLSDLYHKLYEDNKRCISMNVLDILTDTAISVWFLDSGGKTGRSKKNAYINTTKLRKEGTEIVLKFFNEIGMQSTINRDGERLKILFSVDGTEVLLKTIAHRFPTFMYHRI